VLGRDITLSCAAGEYTIQSMTAHTRFHFIGVAAVLAHLLIALFAILLAALLSFLLTYMG
jgi:hypothetical protein